MMGSIEERMACLEWALSALPDSSRDHIRAETNLQREINLHPRYVAGRYDDGEKYHHPDHKSVREARCKLWHLRNALHAESMERDRLTGMLRLLCAGIEFESEWTGGWETHETMSGPILSPGFPHITIRTTHPQRIELSAGSWNMAVDMIETFLKKASLCAFTSEN
jgi:hypothetical protein